MTTERAALLSAVAGRIVAMGRPHPVRVAITGICAAGKTTLADGLAPVVALLGRPVYRCQFDDFHSVGHKWRSARDQYSPRAYYDEAYDFAAFRRFVLDPLSEVGHRRCRLALFSSYHDEFLPEVWTEVEPNAVVIVDGGLLLRPELVGHWDFIIWVDVEPETCVARARNRDVGRRGRSRTPLPETKPADARHLHRGNGRASRCRHCHR